MTPVSAAWTLLAAQMWTCVFSQIPQEPVSVLYPAISSSETLDCDCKNISCDNVFWFRTLPAQAKVEFIGKSNNADRSVYGEVDQDRFKMSKRGSASFALRIINVTEADAGIYSCVLRDSRTQTEKFVPGFVLRPGETPPTLPPTTKTKPEPKAPGCRCNFRYPSGPVGCNVYILWTLVGLLAGLAAIILGTLYYYSRLPKKCRHHFVKKRMLN